MKFFRGNMLFLCFSFFFRRKNNIQKHKLHINLNLLLIGQTKCFCYVCYVVTLISISQVRVNMELTPWLNPTQQQSN